MARLNTRSQAKQNALQEAPSGNGQPKRTATVLRREFQERRSPASSIAAGTREQWSPAMRETMFKKWPAGTTDKQPQERGRLARSGTFSDLNFDIFADSDGASERGGDGTPKSKKASPLKLARANSLILPLPQAPRARTNRKSELYNYDKENDPVEEVVEEETPSLSRNPSDASSTRRSPTRSRNPQQFTRYRQQEPNSGDESGEEDSFNSLEDFIVSDNEELSYHETSGDETEEERQHREPQSPPPPPPPPPLPPRRRLFRGRRADPTVELEKALLESAKNPDLRLEPSLPAAITIPSPTRNRIPRKLFQNHTEVSEKMDRLKLDDFDPSSQLQQDLLATAIELQSPSQTSQNDNSAFKTPPSSPTKGAYALHVDAFWSQEATNDWIDQHSPHKLDIQLQEFDESDCEVDMEIMPRRSVVLKQTKTPSKAALKRAETEAKKAALERKKSFDSKKASLAEEFLKALDDAVADGQVQKRSADTGGVRIVWSKTLQTTAGRASWKRDSSSSSELSSSGRETPAIKPSKRTATIELAERIIDNEDRLINTLAHEYCHLANFMISNVHNNPHGSSFQNWGRKCKEALKNHPVYGGRVEVKTRHSYKIDYKYVWTCVDCGQSYGRHSKSIDPTKSRCGKCKGLLQQIKPKPRSVSPRKKQPPGREVDDVARGLEEVNLDV
ncbi:hypothetical protein AOCH_003061 [Aspergillus ochraceoroseus]|uniref:SprT-like domain-containing protein n=1 Tax=Aspergillus ochraceoroseus TaxID=138278 RepID=A0A0F8VPE8_9EURO|nr:hypothetical protein AOCH_003061 [Aspergillus ochraceoroseus]